MKLTDILLKLNVNLSNCLELRLTKDSFWYCLALLNHGEKTKLTDFQLVFLCFHFLYNVHTPTLPLPKVDCSHYPALGIQLNGDTQAFSHFYCGKLKGWIRAASISLISPCKISCCFQSLVCWVNHWHWTQICKTNLCTNPPIVSSCL